MIISRIGEWLSEWALVMLAIVIFTGVAVYDWLKVWILAIGASFARLVHREPKDEEKEK